MKSGEGDQVDLVAIDNGNSFPWCHRKELPLYKKGPLHTYKWRALPHAQRLYSQDTFDWFNRIDSKLIEAKMGEALFDQETPSSIENIEGKIRTFQERYYLIRTHTLAGASITDIAQKVNDAGTC